jgi:hypothetical protein
MKKLPFLMHNNEGTGGTTSTPMQIWVRIAQPSFHCDFILAREESI